MITHSQLPGYQTAEELQKIWERSCTNFAVSPKKSWSKTQITPPPLQALLERELGSFKDLYDKAEMKCIEDRNGKVNKAIVQLSDTQVAFGERPTSYTHLR